MLKSKVFWSVMGFVLMSSGFLAVILSLVGLEWTPLSVIYSWGPLLSILIQLGLIMTGFVILFVARNPK
jgi:hypothetical protein